MSSTTTPRTRRGLRRLLRPIAAALVAVLAGATLSLTAVAPANAADYVPPATVNLVKGQNVGSLLLVPGDAYGGYIQWPGDSWLPPGLSRDTSTSGFDLVGTPTQAGIFPFYIELQYVSGGPATRHPVEFRVADTPVWSTTTLPDTRVGVAYGMQLAVTPFADSFAITQGSPPPGITMSSSGFLSGAATAHGSYTFTVTATNPRGTASQILTLNVPAPPTWNTTTLPTATLGVPYDYQLDAPGAVSFALLSGSAMPPGLALSPTGRVTGTPTWATTFNFTVNASNLGGSTAQVLSLAIVRPTPDPAWGTTALPGMRAGTPVTVSLQATDATSYAVVGGALPIGLTLSGATIAGTPEIRGASGYDYHVTIRATGPGGSSDQVFMGRVSAPDPIWTTETIGPFVVGQAVDVQLAAQYATSYSRVSGSLPVGLTLDGDGRLHGTPMQTGTETVVLRASNFDGSATESFTVAVNPPAPVWSTTGLPDLRHGTSLSQTLEASNATSYALVDGALPADLRLIGDTISGVAVNQTSDAVNYSFTIRATGPGGTADQTFTGIVKPPRPEWMTQQIGPMVVGVPFEQQLEARYATWYLTILGDLPHGLTLDSHGRLHGTPTQVGVSHPTISAQNGYDINARQFTVHVVPPGPVWQTTTLPPMQVGVPYSATLQATDATGYARTAGTLPAGLTLDGDTLSGTPTARGHFAFTITATGDGGSTAQAFSGDVAAPAVAWVTDALGPFSVGVGVDVQLEATNAVTYEVAEGDLPAGLELTAAGRLHGEPTAAGTTPITFRALNADGVGETRALTIEVTDRATWVGQTSVVTQTASVFTLGAASVANGTMTEASVDAGAPFTAVVTAEGELTFEGLRVGSGTATVEFTNGIGTWSQEIAVEVRAAPAWITESFGDLRQGVAAEITLEAEHTSGFQISEGELPAGLTLQPDGTITGTPEASGSYDVTITAASQVEGFAGVTRQFTGTVAAPLVAWVTSTLPLVQVGDAVDLTLDATNATSFEVTGGELPAGLDLVGNRIVGTPSVPGVASFEVTARNADGEGVTRDLDLDVRALPIWVGATSLLMTTGAEASIPAASVTNGRITGFTPDGPMPFSVSVINGAIELHAIESGVATLEVKYTNGVGSWSQDVTVEVRDAPVWVTGSLGVLREGVAIDLALEATDATGFRVSAGALPAGLALAADGSLTGTPSTRGSYDVTIAATNGDVEVPRRFTGVVVDEVPVWETAALGPFSVGAEVHDSLFAEHAAEFRTAEGSTMPPGLVLGYDGTVSGEPTQAGTFDVTLQAVNADGDAADRAFTIEVLPQSSWEAEAEFLMTVDRELTLPASSVRDGSISAVRALEPDVVEVELTEDGGVLIEAVASGVVEVEVEYGNGVGTWTTVLEVEVRDAPVWVSDAFLDLREGDAVDVQLEAANAIGYSIVDGALPAGVTMAEDGRITGSPTELGRFDVTIAATNGDVVALRTFFGFVSAPLVEWVTDGFDVLDRNVAAELPLDATHAVEFELTDGELPPGLALTEFASIAGTPTTAGTFAFELTAYNASGEPFAREFELVVEQPELSLALRAATGDEASGVAVVADGSGLAPSSAWSVVLHSEPVELATGEATDEGVVEVSTELPASVPFGAHELRFRAIGADEVPVQTSVWFSVGETGLIEQISTTGPVAEPSRTPPATPGQPGQSGQSGRGSAGAIASTGVEPAAWLAIGAALLLAGAVAIGAIGRVRRTATRR